MIDGLPGLPGVGGGIGRVETPRLAPGAALLAHARNRWLHAGLGTWTSNDPNASGQGLISQSFWHGESSLPKPTEFDLLERHGDGPNLLAAYAAMPLEHFDPLGLLIGLLPSPQVLDIYSDYNDEVLSAGASIVSNMGSMLANAAMDQYADLHWALDWTAEDDMYSRRGSFESAGPGAGGAGGDGPGSYVAKTKFDEKNPGLGGFDEKNKAARGGVYLILDKDDNIIYAGRTRNLAQRMEQSRREHRGKRAVGMYVSDYRGRRVWEDVLIREFELIADGKNKINGIDRSKSKNKKYANMIREVVQKMR